MHHYIPYSLANFLTSTVFRSALRVLRWKNGESRRERLSVFGIGNLLPDIRELYRGVESN